MMRRTILILAVLAGLVRPSSALQANITLELVAINDQAALVDYRVTACSDAHAAWLWVDLGTGRVERLRRSAAAGQGGGACRAASATLQARLRQRGLAGVEVDAAQCGKNDDGALLRAKALLEPDFAANWSIDVRRANLLQLSKARAQQTFAALAFGAFASPDFGAKRVGPNVQLTRAGQLVAEVPLRATEGLEESPWVAIAPGGRALVVGDPKSGELTVYAVAPGGAAQPRGAGAESGRRAGGVDP